MGVPPGASAAGSRGRVSAGIAPASPRTGVMTTRATLPAASHGPRGGRAHTELVTGVTAGPGRGTRPPGTRRRSIEGRVAAGWAHWTVARCRWGSVPPPAGAEGDARSRSLSGGIRPSGRCGAKGRRRGRRRSGEG
ncbi:hypothetical protein C3492_07615 [Streptomyces sp. Ru62]|nr:hypothetical protein C3492_07615 [Streptomyces sp. Ru62]